MDERRRPCRSDSTHSPRLHADRYHCAPCSLDEPHTQRIGVGTVSKREGVFCDKKMESTSKLCSGLAVGTCVICDQDICHQHQASFRGIEFVLETRLHHGDHVRQQYDVLRDAEARTEACACLECEKKITRDLITPIMQHAMKDIVTRIRAALTREALGNEQA